MHVKQENTVKPRGATTEMRGEMEWWTELNTGQSWRVWTDQRREAEIGSFWLEENRKEVWPTTAWGGQQETKQQKKQNKQKPVRETANERGRETDRHPQSPQDISQCVTPLWSHWLLKRKLAALYIPSPPEVPIGWEWLWRRRGFTLNTRARRGQESRLCTPFVWKLIND